MTFFDKLPNLLLTTTIIFVLNACNTKTSQETNTTSIPSVPTQQTETPQTGTTPSSSANTPNALQDNNTTNETDTNTTTLQTLTLSIADTTLNKDHNTTLTIEAKYSDGTTEPVTNNIEWITTPSDAVKITGNTLTALKDVNVTLQAKYQSKLSNPVNLNIYWEVDGHRLPPEPDPAVNNATLLGIDSNKNGVRDDVERWIYETYDHPIERGIFMQSARAYNKVIVDPSKAKEVMHYIVDSANCESYWSMSQEEMIDRNLNFTLGEYRDIEKEIRGIQFNTLKRHMAYERFNGELSGGVYGDDLEPEEWIQGCKFDKNGILKALK